MSYNKSVEGSMLLSLLGITDTNIEFSPPLVYPHFKEKNNLELEIECSGNNGVLLANYIEQWLLDNEGDFVKLNDITILIDSDPLINKLLAIFIGAV